MFQTSVIDMLYSEKERSLNLDNTSFLSGPPWLHAISLTGKLMVEYTFDHVIQDKKPNKCDSRHQPLAVHCNLNQNSC